MTKHPGGRPAIWGKRQNRISATLPPEHIEYLKQLGNGNISDAIRQLIDKAGGPAYIAETKQTQQQSNQRPVFIYALCDPGTANVRYIGKTVNPKTRLAQHLLNRKNTTFRMNPCSQWLDSLKAQNMRPDMLILEETTETEWQIKESEWINRLIEQGADLLNVAPGGQSGKWIKTYHAWDEPPQTRKEQDHE